MKNLLLLVTLAAFADFSHAVSYQGVFETENLGKLTIDLELLHDDSVAGVIQRSYYYVQPEYNDQGWGVPYPNPRQPEAPEGRHSSDTPVENDHSWGEPYPRANYPEVSERSSQGTPVENDHGWGDIDALRARPSINVERPRSESLPPENDHGWGDSDAIRSRPQPSPAPRQEPSWDYWVCSNHAVFVNAIKVIVRVSNSKGKILGDTFDRVAVSVGTRLTSEREFDCPVLSFEDFKEGKVFTSIWNLSIKNWGISGVVESFSVPLEVNLKEKNYFLKKLRLANDSHTVGISLSKIKSEIHWDRLLHQRVVLKKLK